MRPILVLATLASAALAQPVPPPTDWSDWKPLVGEWTGDRPKPDSPTGSFTLSPELQGRVLVRKNYAVYTKPTAARHDDLMVIYKDGATTRADYWDNEAHVIHYTVTVDKNRWVFVSEGPGPRFRLTYILTSPTALGLLFEMAPPGEPIAWKQLIQATLHKK
jgi:hypothetical protein